MRILAINDKLNSLENIESDIKSVAPSASVIVFSNIDEAVSYAMLNKIDVVFLSSLFESASGIDIALKLSRKYPSLNIIFYNKDAVFMREAFAARASGYMLCPVTREKIQNEIKNLRYAV